MPDPSDHSTPGGATDATLLRRFRKGEQCAATELYTRYADRLARLADRNTGEDLASRFDAEDVVQSVFRTFCRRAQDGCYNLPDGEELWRLLLVLALNKVRSLAIHHRAQKRNVGATRLPDQAALESNLYKSWCCEKKLGWPPDNIQFVCYNYPHSRVYKNTIEA